MEKFIIIITLFIVALIMIKAQNPETTSSPVPMVNNSEEEVIRFQEIALGVIEIRIVKANLPNDLLIIALQVLENSRITFDNCKDNLQIDHIIWQYKVCVSTHLKVAHDVITNLELEAANRLESSDATL